MAARRRLLSVLLGLTLGSTFLLARLAHDWIVEDGPSLCAYRAVTGEPCCFCGLTRSFARATHGELDAALAANPGWWAAAAIVGGLAVGLVIGGIAGRDVLGACGRVFRRWWWALLLAVAALTAARAL